MCIEDIKALPVGELAAKDCALFLWITFPCLCEALEVLTAWGFSYKTVAFVWVKQKRKNDDLFTGMGNWTRANAEICILAKMCIRDSPFSYIRSEKDILKLVNTIIVNTKGDGDKSGEDFWVKAEKLYYTALIGYIWYEAPDHEKNFTTLLEMINASEAREDDETFKNPVDVMFDELEARDPDHFAVKQYRKYKLAAGKTAKSILISCGARLAPFDIAELRELMSYDEMELDTIGDRKTALFVIISDTDDTFNFVVAIMYSQLFNLLCDKADDVYNGRLPVHVRCLLDEFANIGQIPKFDKLIATIRSREISASIILQSQSQLKTIYKDAADTITGNCDCTLFLGGKEKSTLKEISEVLGKETIDLYNTSETRSNNNSYGLNYQKTGKELMSQDEIAVMDGAKCILQLRGVPHMRCSTERNALLAFPRYWNSSSTMTMRCETSCVRRSNRSSQRSKDACLIRSSSRKSATTPLKVARFWASDSSVARK